MTAHCLWRSVREDLRRHLRQMIAGGLAVALSIATLVFFVALGLGVRRVLLGEVFPLDRIEVLPATADLNLLALKIELGSDTLDSTTVTDLGNVVGVAAVYPKMRVLVPAVATGGEGLIGSGFQTELVADGIDPGLVADELGPAFHDPQLDEGAGASPCGEGAACPAGTACVGQTAFTPGECREIIPVVVSNHMVELYNGAFRRAYTLPKLNPNALVGFGIEVAFGASSLRPSTRPIIRHRLELVGVTDAAIPLGVTMPLGFVRQLNRALGPRGAGDGFHSAVVELTGKDVAAAAIEAIESRGLTVQDGGARRAAYLTTMLLATIGAVGAVVVTVSALHVLHVFALMVLIRRREIGVMRAVGASRRDVRALLVAEAAVVGLVAGLAGVVGARVLGWLTDRALASGLPDFPFKPASFFSFDPWLLAAALAVALVACIMGALGPAIRATAADPSELISGE